MSLQSCLTLCDIAHNFTLVQIRSVAQSCPTLCDPMNRSTPGLPVHHKLPEFTETHVHRVSDAIQPSHPLSLKKAEHWRIDALELWWWRKLLRVPWTARRSNQSILKEISPQYSLEGLMLKLKLQYFGHLMWRTDSLEKTLMLGKIEGQRRRGRQRMRWLDGITDPMDVSLSELRVGDGQGGLACCDSWGHKESDTSEWLNWTELSSCSINISIITPFL